MSLLETEEEFALPTRELRQLANHWQEVNFCGCPHLAEMLWGFWAHLPCLLLSSLNCARSVTIEKGVFCLILNSRGRARKSVCSGSACSILYLQIPCPGKNRVWQRKLSGLYCTPQQIPHFIIRLGWLPDLEEEEIKVWTSFRLYAFLF